MTAYTVGRLKKKESTLEGILNNTKKQSPLKRRSLHCGDVGWCARKALAAMFSDKIGENDVSSSLYMAIGTAIHKTIEAALKEAGVLVSDEHRITAIGGVPISGYVDAIVELNGELAVLELKSCGKAPAEPKPEHVAQAIVYGLATGIKRKLILYVGRNVKTFVGLDLTEFEVEDDGGLLTATAREIALAHVYREALRLPPPRLDASASKCAYCPFVSECVDGGKWPLRAPSFEELKGLENNVEALTERILNDYANATPDAANFRQTSS